MKCKSCIYDKTKVVNTYSDRAPRGFKAQMPKGVIRRLRECPACGAKFNTFEFEETEDVLSMFRRFMKREQMLEQQDSIDSTNDFLY